MIRTEVICKNVSYLNIVKIKMQFYWNKWDFLMLHNNWYTVHHFCTGKKHKFLSSVGERFCKIKFYFFMFSISVMPILVMCLMTALSPQDRGFVSIVFLLSSSLTDHRLKYHCVPNPGDSVCIQRCPKDEIPTLLTISVIFGAKFVKTQKLSQKFISFYLTKNLLQ